MNYILLFLFLIIIILIYKSNKRVEGYIFNNKMKSINTEINDEVYNNTNEFDILTYDENISNENMNPNFILGFVEDQAYLIYRYIKDDIKNVIHKKNKSGSCCPTDENYNKGDLEYCNSLNSNTCETDNSNCKWNKNNKCSKSKLKKKEGICCGGEKCNGKNMEKCTSDSNKNICYWLKNKKSCLSI